MSILNMTPDSFSDGGLHTSENLESTIRHMIATGTTIIDVGGQSTRPGAVEVSAAEEISRVIPAIETIRRLPEAKDITVSIDTYRASVAEAAVSAGADIINDVFAGQLDPAMLPTMARLGTSVILMHARGTPATMKQLADYPDGLISTVAAELDARVRAAEAAGIRRWRIILDPGIGFAKNAKQNLQLLRKLKDLRESPGLHGLPWLVGASRKAFIGQISGVMNPQDRVWGTAATVVAAVQGGADIVRVHDSEEMMQVVKVADAIYRDDEMGTI
jgi:2-amino-4-hydroxy-6-hydroxymethyldihydropteridine diphosphokinase/dihydropteroate synthase